MNGPLGALYLCQLLLVHETCDISQAKETTYFFLVKMVRFEKQPKSKTYVDYLSNSPKTLNL